MIGYEAYKSEVKSRTRDVAEKEEASEQLWGTIVKMLQ